MIDSAINHIASLLNQYLKRSFDLNEDIVIASNILEQDGSIAQNISNRLLVFLVNIQKDSEAYSRNAGAAGSSRSVVSHPPVHLNLFVMFAANFNGNNYPEALKFISNTIGFFQRRPVFDRENTPDLDANIEKLILDMESLNINDLSNLWSILSSRYMPSVLYKIRMVTIDAMDVTAQVSLVTEPQSSVHLP